MWVSCSLLRLTVTLVPTGLHVRHIHSRHLHSRRFVCAGLPRRFSGLACVDFVCDGAGWILVRARVLVIARRQAFADLHRGEHAAHLDCSELAETRHHRQRVVGKWHLHLAHHRHAVGAHRHRVRRHLLDGLRQHDGRNADEVNHVVAHRIHGVVRLVAVKRPVAGHIGEDIEHAHRSHRHVDSRFRPLRAFRYPAAIRAADRDVVAVQMDGMVGHREIAHSYAHAVSEPHRQRVNAGKYPRVKCPQVEVRHLGDLRQSRAGIKTVSAHDEDEVAIDAAEVRIARMHDEHAHHAHRHLHHLVGVRGALIDHLGAEIRSTSVANVVDNLCYAARLIAPERDWQWLASIKARLLARARPEDRFDRLVPPWQILDFGIELMDDALSLPSNGHKQRQIQYRDGLILALLILLLLRRRSVAALTVSRHIEFDHAGINILLHPEDTKAKRAESFRVPDQLLSYLLHYLKDIRPRLLGRSEHDGLWASYRGRPLIAGRIYDIVRARTKRGSEKPWGFMTSAARQRLFWLWMRPKRSGSSPVCCSMPRLSRANGLTICRDPYKRAGASRHTLLRLGTGFGQSQSRTRDNPMRAVIYARYSTDLQSSASIDDQVRLCRERIERDGHALTQVYNDRAVSGASLMRPGIQSLMRDANRGVFDIVYAEALDRISRDQEDAAGFFKRIRFADVRIMTLAEGEISELHVGLKGTMNALFLKDLAQKTRRGLQGRVLQGLSGGGLAMGTTSSQERREFVA